MNAPARKIIHCDCDCFYAAVEMRDDPSLRFSETGRMLLRLLAPAALDDDLLERLVGSVPQHDIELVSELGAICLQLWQDVVARLDRRRAASG